RGIGVSLQLGIVATGVAYYLFSKGLVHVSSSTAVTLALAEPLTAALLGVVIVGETLNLLSWAGLSLLILGIGMLIWASKNDVKEEQILKEKIYRPVYIKVVIFLTYSISILLDASDCVSFGTVILNTPSVNFALPVSGFAFSRNKERCIEPTFLS